MHTNKGRSVSKETQKRTDHKLRRATDTRSYTTRPTRNASIEKRVIDKLSSNKQIQFRTLQELRDTFRATKSVTTRNVVSNDEKRKVRSNLRPKEIIPIKHNNDKVKEYVNIHLKHSTTPIKKINKFTETKPTNSKKMGIFIDLLSIQSQTSCPKKNCAVAVAIKKYSTPIKEYRRPSSSNHLQTNNIKKITRVNKSCMLRSSSAKESQRYSPASCPGGILLRGNTTCLIERNFGKDNVDVKDKHENFKRNIKSLKSRETEDCNNDKINIKKYKGTLDIEDNSKENGNHAKDEIIKINVDDKKKDENFKTNTASLKNRKMEVCKNAKINIREFKGNTINIEDNSQQNSNDGKDKSIIINVDDNEKDANFKRNITSPKSRETEDCNKAKLNIKEYKGTIDIEGNSKENSNHAKDESIKININDKENDENFKRNITSLKSTKTDVCNNAKINVMEFKGDTIDMEDNSQENSNDAKDKTIKINVNDKDKDEIFKRNVTSLKSRETEDCNNAKINIKEYKATIDIEDNYKESSNHAKDESIKININDKENDENFKRNITSLKSSKTEVCNNANINIMEFKSDTIDMENDFQENCNDTKDKSIKINVDDKDRDENFKRNITSLKSRRTEVGINAKINIMEFKADTMDTEDNSQENSNDVKHKSIKINVDDINKDENVKRNLTSLKSRETEVYNNAKINIKEYKSDTIDIKDNSQENSNNAKDKSNKIEENTNDNKDILCEPKLHSLEEKVDHCKNCIISFKTQVKKGKISCMTHRAKQCKSKVRNVVKAKLLASKKTASGDYAIGEETVDESSIYGLTNKIEDINVSNKNHLNFTNLNPECKINSIFCSPYLGSSSSSFSETSNSNCCRPNTTKLQSMSLGKPISFKTIEELIKGDAKLLKCKISDVYRQGGLIKEKQTLAAVTDHIQNEDKPLIPVDKEFYNDNDLIPFKFEDLKLFTKDDMTTIEQEGTNKPQEYDTSSEYEEDVSELREIMENIRATWKIADSLSGNELIRQAAELRHGLNRLKFAVDLLEQKYNFKIYLLETIKSELKIRARNQMFNVILKSSNFGNYFEDTSADYMFRSLCDIGYNLPNGVEDNIPETSDEVKYELKIADIRKIGPSSLFVKWSISTIRCVIGYEILVNDVLKSRVFSPGRRASTLDGLGAQITLLISVYAVTSNGRCEPPAVTSYTLS